MVLVALFRARHVGGVDFGAVAGPDVTPGRNGAYAEVAVFGGVVLHDYLVCMADFQSFAHGAVLAGGVVEVIDVELVAFSAAVIVVLRRWTFAPVAAVEHFVDRN